MINTHAYSKFGHTFSSTKKYFVKDLLVEEKVSMKRYTFIGRARSLTPVAPTALLQKSSLASRDHPIGNLSKWPNITLLNPHTLLRLTIFGLIGS